MTDKKKPKKLKRGELAPLHDDDWNGRGIAPSERESSHHHEDLMMNEPPHGEPGHGGYKCSECAQEGKNQVRIHPNTGDYWQTKQIEWQEQCDVIFRQFDDDVAAHFPQHLPRGCENCPEPPELPPKPIVPVERAMQQESREV